MFVPLTTACSEQVTKEPSKDSNERPGKDAKDVEVKRSDELQLKLSATAGVPEVFTLLEFIAWVVLESLDSGGKQASGLKSHSSASWMKGRGGYLADQLDTVQEASIRLQVPGLLCALCFLSSPLCYMAELHDSRDMQLLGLVVLGRLLVCNLHCSRRESCQTL